LRREKKVNVLSSSVVQLLFFGSLSGLMIAQGPEPSPVVIALFGVGEMGAASILCSFIVRHFRRHALPAWLLENVVGFGVSHLCILMVVPPECPQTALAWMELTLRVSVIVVLTTTAGVLFKPGIRRPSAVARTQGA
jgi:hypothetical protein